MRYLLGFVASLGLGLLLFRTPEPPPTTSIDPRVHATVLASRDLATLVRTIERATRSQQR